MSYNNRFYSFFGLKYNPFEKNNSDLFRFESNDVKELNIRLDHLLSNKGIGLITGRPGLGKTSSVRNYVSKLNKSLYKVVYIPHTTLTEMDLLYLLVREFGYEPKGRKSSNIKTIQQAIIDYSESKKMTPIIIFDEANYLSSSFLNSIKMILNFKMDSCDKFVVILMGLPVIISTLSNAAHEPLRQRIVMNYEFEGFTNSDTLNYITGKIETAGCNSIMFEEGAIQLICNHSQNTPRIIDSIMTYSLLIASQLKSNTITKDIINNAISQFSI